MSLACDDSRAGQPDRAVAVCPACRCHDTMWSIWPVLQAGQGSLEGLLLFALAMHDKCVLSCVKRYTIHFLQCLHSTACYAVTLACDDSRAGQAVIGAVSPSPMPI